MNKEIFTSLGTTANQYDRQSIFKATLQKYRCLFILFGITLLFGLDAQAQVRWSNPSSWTAFGATKPVAGSSVTIPADVQMILDESTPSLANLTIMGKLEFDDMDLNLTAGYIMVHGTLQVGTATVPYTKKAIITLNASDMTESVMNMGTRGIMVMAGKLELHGVPPTKNFTKLSDHSAMGSTSLSILDNVNWKVGDQIVVAGTDYFADAQFYAPEIKSIPLKTQITAISGTTINIQDALNAQRWGKLQYLTATGMSLTPGTLPANIVAGTPTVLDERGEVVNLTRNIVIQSVDDDLWHNSGFGCHVMIMRMNGMAGEAHLNGVEIKRGGQAGKLGRYPFHWHMLSYEGVNTLADATGQYIKNSTLNQSMNRGIVIHGTNGTEVSNNIIYDVRGHGIFTENASERRNIIDGNIVMKIRNPSDDKALKLHETWRNGSSGFWISNPDNTITNNTVTDSEGFGFWLAYPIKPVGTGANLPLVPIYMKFGSFNNNTAHSNQKDGIFLDAGESDEEGNVDRVMYYSTSDMKPPSLGSGVENVLKFQLNNNVIWKNNVSGTWMGAAWGMNSGSISADNTARFFAGRTSTVYPSVIDKALVVGTSLNYNMNGVTMPNTNGGGSGPRSAFASYHSTADIKNNVVVNFPAVEGRTSGFMALDDYYLIPVDKGNVRNTGNILINTHMGVRTMPDGPQFTFSPLLDKHNYAGVEQSDDNFYVFDKPFFTYGQNRQIVAPSSAVSGGVIIKGPYYGYASYRINGVDRLYDKINAIRTTADGNFIDNWVVEAPLGGEKLSIFRHFATHPTGYYYLDFPTLDDINDFDMKVYNMLTENDYQVMSVEFSGNYDIQHLFTSTVYNMNEFGVSVPFPTSGTNTHDYTVVADFQSVVNAPTGEVYWHDKANNKVWFKVRGGVNPGYTEYPEEDDGNLNKIFNFRVYGALSTSADTQAPTVPTGLASSNITSTSLTLNWTASTDNIGVTGYEVFRDGVSQGTVTTTSYNATGLTASTAYGFTVRAKDAVNNFSAQSTALNISTSSTVNGTLFTGTSTGSSAYNNDSQYAVANVFDASISTFFAPASNTNSFAQLDMGTSISGQPTNIVFYPRVGYTDRMVGGEFQASTDGLDWVTLYTISSVPTETWNTVSVSSSNYYRYFRYFQANNLADVSEIEFRGTTQSTVTYPIITSRGENSPNETKEKAFDSDNLTKWLDYSATTWLQVQYQDPVVYNQYAMVSGNDSPGKDPKDWVLKGSNNGTNWTTLHEQADQSWSGRNQVNNYLFSNTTAYAYYKLDVTANTDGGSATQLSELSFDNIEILPVSLVNFSGRATLNGNVLSWRTRAERNNSGFQILRSRNGKDFEQIGFKKSSVINGNSSSPLDYSYSDVTSDTDVYYKLNQLDNDGKATASQTIVVKAMFATENQVYPNPTTNSFNVSTVDAGAKITVTTLEGRVIRTIIATGKVTTIDSGNWLSGMYIIQIQSASGTTVKKLVVSK